MVAMFAFALLALTSPVSDTSGAGRVLMDFRGDGLADQWITVNDNVMGGRSKGGPSFTGRSLVFRGETVTDGGGFSSIRTKPRRWSLADGSGIWIRFRADGREYQIDLRQGSSRRGRSTTYRAKFRTTKSSSDGGDWQVARLAFEDFQPQWRGRFVRGAGALDPSKVTTIGIFIYDGKAGPFRIEVDAIGLVPRTMSGSPRGARRALDRPVELGPIESVRAALASRRYGALAQIDVSGLKSDAAFSLYREAAQVLRRASTSTARSALADWLRRAARDARIDGERWQSLLETRATESSRAARAR